ncbi:MAG: bifunctional folylpolyglutamate synthase/dihydrofolate synthase, partial [Bacteroidetes bacterium]
PQRVKSPLNATYQIKNIACVLAACKVLQHLGWPLKQKNIHTAIQNTPQLTGFQGRWQIIQTKPYIVLDIAHNKQGIQSALQNLKRYSYNTLRIIFGVAKDKEIDDILPLLPKNAIYYITQASVPRAMSAEMLYEKMSSFRLKSPPFPTVSDAIASTLHDAGKNDFILIFGSAFVVADALTHFNSSQK